MTIKEFASLCGCNPQTLRYYDHVDLLKPVKVDEWSGYRYYNEEQALVYVKIKNLQKAGFSIDEIKGLLDKDNQVIFDAFSAKVREQEEKLAEIKRIQMSYQTEMSEMNHKLESLRAFIVENMQAYDPSEEFGIDQDTYQGMIGQVNEYFSAKLSENLNWDEENARDEADEVASHDFLSDPEYEIVYEKHGWRHVKDFFDEFSALQDGQEYALVFKIAAEKAMESVGTAFANIMLGMLLQKKSDKHITLGCNIRENSEDDQNHFYMLKRK